MKTKTLYITVAIAIPLLVLLSWSFAIGQPLPGAVRFKKGVFSVEKNVATGQLQKESFRSVHYRDSYYALIQFDRLPNPAQKKELAGLGVRLFDYVPDRAYLAEIKDSFSTIELRRYSVSGISPMPATFKIAGSPGQRPDNYLHATDRLIAVNWFGNLDPDEIRQALAAAGAVVIPTKIQPPHTLFIRVATAAILQKVADLPFVSYLAAQPMTPKVLNYNNRAAHGADALSAPSGRYLKGDGVFIGVGDDTDPYTHIDFTGRQIDRFAAPPGSGHGVHTSGTAGGGGILNPMYQGMAPHSMIISQYFSDILTNAPTYVTDYDMSITSNSYTDYNGGCTNDGTYDALANYTDAQLFSYPNMLHFFAAGNDGMYTCSPYPAQFATIKSGFQSAKNVVDVGSLNNFTNTLSAHNSSCGPTEDGRIKPEVVAGGVNIISTFPYNTYVPDAGTSMACPTVAGSVALLVQRYRQLHGGADPSAALLKALICNTANDLGNPGPDFMYGFGALNILAADQVLEGNQYSTGSVDNGGSAQSTITVPAGAQQVRITLCWTDYPAAPYAATALVNNLDLTVTAPGSVLHHPLILNTNPANVNDVAVEGVDTLNNIEEVVINNPTGGAFTINVAGTSIPQGPQNYAIAYDIIQPSIQLMYPYGNETWVTGASEIIRWVANDGGTANFTIEYSADNGSTWTTINNAVPATPTLYNWTVPSTATNTALIRVTRNGTSYSDVSHYPITVLGQPALTVTNPCQGYAQLLWGTVPAATSYDIMQLAGDSMLKVASTTDTTYLLGNLNRDSSYWLAVRAVNAGTPGRRSVAANTTPAGGSCALTVLNNDYTVDSVIGLSSGRLYTSTQLGAGIPITVELKNLGTIPPGGPYTMSYQVNGGTVITETTSATVAPNGVYDYTFSTPYNFSAAGTYNLQVWVTYSGDPQPGNDTISAVISQLSNDPIILNPSYTEGFESAVPAAYYSPTIGLNGLDRCDFFTNNPNGRARTFINTGFARTGDRCATLDALHYSTTSAADSLITTFNLVNYSSGDQIWLDFYYQNQGIVFSLGGNQVWIRGNDQAAWIPVCILDTNAANVGIYQPSPHIDVTGALKAASQSPTSSFQIKFGEQGYTSTNDVVPDGDLDNGYSFDDITLSRSTNDLAMSTLVAPNLSDLCSLSNAETISVVVKNYSDSTAINIPVTYSVNGNTVTETIPSIGAGDSIVYSFSHTADLSAWQVYTITGWVSYPGDTYLVNDTLLPVRFQTTPLISTYPYLQGFETNNGYWYTGGTNSSWQWGTPQKTIIDKAANGSKCWVTSLTGDYNNNELSYLYSPCFDVSSLQHPVLSFSHIFQTEDDCACDYHWAEYSTDGVNWIKLGAVDSGTNWYDDSVNKSWQKSYTRWHVSSYSIPATASPVRFRIVMSSDGATTYEGVGIDDIHLFDEAAVYTGPDITSGLAQSVSGSNWINFNAGGGMVAAINPNGQDLGMTNVMIYFNHTGAVRHDSLQYYLDRNIVIQPSNPPSDSVTVRYYFLDSEADTLIGATGCSSCTTIADAYQSGVAQYSSPVLAEEDSTLANDTTGLWTFHQHNQGASIIPNDKGYYAEYSVKGFSEFWICPQAPVQPNSSLPALLSFTAVRSGNSALLQWTALHDQLFTQYLLQKSTTDTLHFTTLDSLSPLADTAAVNAYRYTDPNLRPGISYYRLQITDLNGNVSYSVIRSVNVPGAGAVITIYPNPVQDGTLYISSTVNCRNVRLTDVLGRLILNQEVQGYLQTLELGTLAPGIYLLITDTDTGRQVQKVFVK